MSTPVPTCSDVLAAFNKARDAAGDKAALAVIHRLGSRYAATIAPKDYGVAIMALNELIRHSQAAEAVTPLRKAAA